MMLLGLVAEANAQAANIPAAAHSSFDPMSLLPFVLIIVIFYFLIFRPQQKRVKQQREMLSALRRGDKVVTAGGIFGTISRIEGEHELHVEIAPDVVVKLNRGSVTDVVTKTTSLPEGKSSSDPKGEAKVAIEESPKSKAVEKLKPTSAPAGGKKPASRSSVKLVPTSKPAPTNKK